MDSFDQQSAAVAHQATVRYTDHNKGVTDIANLLAGANAGGLLNPLTLGLSAEPTTVMLVRYKPSAFTFGSTPKTSDGYVRLPSGMPWAADSITGLPESTSALTGTTTSTVAALIHTVDILLPAMAAATVTKVAITVPVHARNDGTSGWVSYVDKMGLTVLKVAADGTVSTLGAESEDATIEGTASTDESVLHTTRTATVDLGAGQAIAATERLGVRIKLYGKVADASHTCYLTAFGYDAILKLPPRPAALALWFA